MKNPESELISLLITGDESTFRIIYEKYAEKVYSFALLFLKDTGWSEDVVQEVFVKLWNSKERLDPDKDLWNFLYVITKRISLNKLRDIKYYTSSFDQLWTNISRSSDCSYTKLNVKELAEQLDVIIDQLPVRQREVFKLSRFEGLTHQQIAEELQISQNTVKNHMIQALKAIRRGNLGVDYFVLSFGILLFC